MTYPHAAAPASLRPLAARHRVALLCGWLVLAALWLAASSAPAHAARPPVPAYSSSIVDLTNTLNEPEAQALRAQVAALEQSAQAVVTVLIVPTTGDDSIEQFATRVFDKWKPGDKDRDDGVLLLVALKDRRMRIEVGQGLEGVLPDVLAGHIIDREMKPRFKANDYHGGLEAAINAIAVAIQGAAPGGSAEAPPFDITAPEPLIDDTAQIQSVDSEGGDHEGGITPFGWAFLASMVWSFAAGAVRGVRTWKAVASAALIVVGPFIAAVVLREPGVAVAALMPSALAFGAGFGVVRYRVARLVLGGFAVVIGGLVALGNAVGADRFAWGLLWLMCAAGAGLVLTVIAIGVRMSWRRSVFVSCARMALVIGIVAYVAQGNMPTDELTSWIPVAAAAVLSMLFIFFPADGMSSGGGSSGSSSGSWSSGSSSSSSSSSSSRSSSSGGSSSGGGASGSW